MREINDLSSYWMPFTANRDFMQSPRLIEKSAGCYYTDVNGTKLLDACAGLFCVNLGHGRLKIAEAIASQAKELMYSPPFQYGHPKAFELAQRLTKHTPEGFDHVFYSCSGSESVETALKMALAYHRLNGEGGRYRLIGRELGYHGVNLGGTSVGGMVRNRKMFGNLLSGVDHLKHTLDIKNQAFSRGLPPERGVELADHLLELINLHDASTIAAVIIEPIAGSFGIILPPVGYLERIREICTQHGILLIFDEVITGFGRLGNTFASKHFNVTPDIFTSAKGLTNGSVPMGAIFPSNKIYDCFMTNSDEGIEFYHGYTYSGHPLACAAALASLDIYEEEKLFTRAGEFDPIWHDALHSLRDKPHVIDIRSIPLLGAIQLEPIPGKPGKRGAAAMLAAVRKEMVLRVTGDVLILSPPLVVTQQEIDKIINVLGEVLLEIE